ncbi:hypothetical protein FS800_26655 [Agrobacterium vitis]|nr:hypothetical protein [Allorhizobium ampelinum]
MLHDFPMFHSDNITFFISGFVAIYCLKDSEAALRCGLNLEIVRAAAAISSLGNLALISCWRSTVDTRLLAISSPFLASLTTLRMLRSVRRSNSEGNAIAKGAA